MKYCLFFYFYSLITIGQNQYPQDYFRAPLDIPMQLAGNFGELRPNHFHAGFDFKTNQREGLNIYAAADGYISRIKISQFGYGKAIYISHPNGYTTVYGHLQSGVGEIEKFIKKEQYKAKSYEIEVTPNPNELKVKKGDVIAISGNTGGSEGPHLHFEIRDGTTEKTLNPLLFGFNKFITDTKNPTVTNVMVFPVDENSIVNQSKTPVSLSLDLQKDGTYIAQKVMASGKIGFGIVANDYDNVSWNPNGVYKVTSYLNGSPFFGYQFDVMSFDEMRCVNALIDYKRYKKMKQRVQKLFMKNPFSWSNITATTANGVINLNKNTSQTVRIEVADFFGNVTKISIPIVYSASNAVDVNTPVVSKYTIKAKKDNIFSLNGVTVSFPTNTFYDDFTMNFDVKNGILTLHEDTVPAHSNFNITFEDSISDAKEREKMFIAYFDGKKFNYCTTKQYKNTFTTYVKTLGQYKLMKDTIAPKVSMSKVIKDKWLSDQKTFQLTISDDLSGIKTFDGYLNGKWILLEYESKLKRLTHKFSDGVVAEGKNELKVIVTDNVGNSTIFETQFYRSQKP
jgi:hypothetical protein